jgi:acyl-CoA synthetase (NDP forming)
MRKEDFMGNLTKMFNPSSIAIIGASTDPARIGGKPVRFLKQYFEGAIYPINPNRLVVQDLPSYASIDLVPSTPDLALIAVPAENVLNAVEDCARKGVQACIVLSAGFAEEGEAGRILQKRLIEIAKRTGIRVLGPNCLGVGNNRIGSWATFAAGAERLPPKGRVSVVSQSGGFASYLLAVMEQRNIPLNHWITVGNQADVSLAECLEFLVEDSETDVIFVYLEGIDDGRRFIEALKAAKRNGKRVVVLKVGNSEAGGIAASSHTAILAGDDAVYSGVLKQYGAYRAATLSEALDVVYACTRCPTLPKSRRVAIMSASGGLGVLMADEAAKVGLDVAPLSEPVQQRIAEFLPNSSVRNPIDLTGQVLNDFSIMEKTLDTLYASEECEMVVNYLMGIDRTPLLSKLMSSLAKFREGRPNAMVAVVMAAAPDVRAQFEDMGYLVFETPYQPFKALAALNFFSNSLGGVDADNRDRQSATFDLPAGEITLNEIDSKTLLSKAGLPVPPDVVVSSEDTAVAAASTIGYPVAMKIVSADILHKSDIGGVKLRINSDSEVRKAYNSILSAAREKVSDGSIDGVLVTKMISEGLEFVIGINNDPTFGPVVMLGLGGILIEFLKRVTFRQAPLSEADVRAMLAEIEADRLLHGLRGKGPADEGALIDAVLRASDLAVACADRLSSVDINPIVVLPQGQGAAILDAVVSLRSVSPSAANEQGVLPV